MNATIVEVARKSGTSLSTVSRVLSNSAYPVNEKTRKRVVEAAEALGYRPNSAARMLRSRRSMDRHAVMWCRLIGNGLVSPPSMRARR